MSKCECCEELLNDKNEASIIIKDNEKETKYLLCKECSLNISFAISDRFCFLLDYYMYEKEAKEVEKEEKLKKEKNEQR